MVTNCMLNATFSKTIINASTSHFYESTGQEQPIDALHAIFIGIECVWGQSWYCVGFARCHQANVELMNL